MYIYKHFFSFLYWDDMFRGNWYVFTFEILFSMVLYMERFRTFCIICKTQSVQFVSIEHFFTVFSCNRDRVLKKLVQGEFFLLWHRVSSVNNVFQSMYCISSHGRYTVYSVQYTQQVSWIQQNHLPQLRRQFRRW